MLRLHGKTAGILSLMGDLFKGVIPVLIARYSDTPRLGGRLIWACCFSRALVSRIFQFQGRQRGSNLTWCTTRHILVTRFVIYVDLGHGRQYLSLFISCRNDSSLMLTDICLVVNIKHCLPLCLFDHGNFSYYKTSAKHKTTTRGNRV